MKKVVIGTVVVGIPLGAGAIFLNSYMNSQQNMRLVQEYKAAVPREGKMVQSHALHDAGRVFTRKIGDGEVTVLLEPGLGTPSFHYWELAEHLASQLGVSVITYDHPGYGWSDINSKENPKQVLRPRDNAALMHDVLQSYGADSVVLLSFDEGGYYAREFAMQHPGAVRGAVFVNPNLRGATDAAINDTLATVETLGAWFARNGSVWSANPEDFLVSPAYTEMSKGFFADPLFWKLRREERHSLLHYIGNVAVPLELFPPVPVSILYHNPEKYAEGGDLLKAKGLNAVETPTRANQPAPSAMLQQAEAAPYREMMDDFVPLGVPVDVPLPRRNAVRSTFHANGFPRHVQLSKYPDNLHYYAMPEIADCLNDVLQVVGGQRKASLNE